MVVSFKISNLVHFVWSVKDRALLYNVRVGIVGLQDNTGSFYVLFFNRIFEISDLSPIRKQSIEENSLGEFLPVLKDLPEVERPLL